MFANFLPFIDQSHRWVQRIRVGAYTREAFEKEEHVPVIYLLSDSQIKHLQETTWADVASCKAFINSCCQLPVTDIMINDSKLGLRTDDMIDVKMADVAKPIVYCNNKVTLVSGLCDQPEETLLGYAGVKQNG